MTSSNFFPRIMLMRFQSKKIEKTWRRKVKNPGKMTTFGDKMTTNVAFGMILFLNCHVFNI